MMMPITPRTAPRAKPSTPRPLALPTRYPPGRIVPGQAEVVAPSSGFAARRSVPASTGFTSTASASARLAMNRSASRSSSSMIGTDGTRPAAASRCRSIATAMPPMLPIWRSSTTRSGFSTRTVSRTSWPRLTSMTSWPGATNATRTWSRTHLPSAATRIFATAQQPTPRSRSLDAGIPGVALRAARVLLLVRLLVAEEVARDRVERFEVDDVVRQRRDVRDDTGADPLAHAGELRALAGCHRRVVGKVLVAGGESRDRGALVGPRRAAVGDHERRGLRPQALDLAHLAEVGMDAVHDERGDP